MKNNKGFTLIELLAVIVILAVLMLIAIPAILNIMNKSKENAFKDQTISIYKAAETEWASQTATDGAKAITFTSGTATDLEMTGTKDVAYSVTVSDEGKVTAICAKGTDYAYKSATAVDVGDIKTMSKASAVTCP